VAAVADVDVTSLVLNPVNPAVRDTQIVDAITDGNLERTIDGASTLDLTLHDPRRSLIRSGLFGYQIDVQLDKLWFRLVKVTKNDDDLTLTFEDRSVALLRKQTKPRKASRSDVTRAQFALSLVREIRPAITFVAPDLTVRQPVAGVTDKRSAARALPYQFRRGGTGGVPEDSWTCLQRLAQEVNWRCFAQAGAVYFASDATLMRTQPQMKLTEDSPGVATINFDLDSGKPLAEATITCRAARWAGAPGTVVVLSGLGPADGNWLVSNVRRNLYQADATITIKRAVPPLAEPAPASRAVSSSRVSGRAALNTPGTTSNSQAEAAYAAAQAMDAKKYPYVWGGGHGAAGVPGGSPPGFDCSGSTVAILAAARMGFRPGGPSAVSGTLASWGEPGEGQFLTIWANAVHVFMVFHTAKGDQHFGTGRWGDPYPGPTFNPQMHPTSGFTPRHWPGT
jgi:cell wall-associated NlpC family hydrolase